MTVKRNQPQLKLILIRGLPGSGKSTMAQKMEGFIHIESDMYFERDGQYTFDSSHLKKAHDWCFKSVREALENGRDVVVTNTYVRLWEMKRFLKLARKIGADVKILEANGDWLNVHDVPDATIARMKKRWQEFDLSRL